MNKEIPGIYNWTAHEGVCAPVRQPSVNVAIDNETWRDGMQGTHSINHPTTEQRMDYLQAAAQNNYSDHFDIGFPASGETHKDQIIDLINFSVLEHLDLTFSAAGRGAAEGDVRAILEVAQRTGVALEADLFLDASSLRARVEGWDRGTKLGQLRANIVLAKKNGIPVMFVPERASVTSPEELFEVCKIAADEGVDRIAIADTTGVLTPRATSNIFRETFERVGKPYPDIKFDFHEHEDLGMGIANSIVAVSEGVDRLHATSRGIGERAGNVSLEQLLVVLNLQGFRNVDTSKIQQFALMAAEILSVPIGSHEPVVGLESTATSSGVHASTYAKGKSVEPIYFAFNPADVGLKPIVKIGPLSGLSNVEAVCKRLGLDVTEEEKVALLNQAKTEWTLLSDEEVTHFLRRNGSK
nr:hypothetical protein [Candidatus Levybacteria bacterium]